MSSSIHCPRCAGGILNDLGLSGQQATCPHCSQLFMYPIPVAEPPLPMVYTVRPGQSRLEQRAIEQSGFYVLLGWAMVAATIGWVVVMPMLAVSSYRDTIDRYQAMGGGVYLRLNRSLQSYEVDSQGRTTLLTKSEVELEAMFSAIFGGLCFPTVPYVILMVVLIVIRTAIQR